MAIGAMKGDTAPFAASQASECAVVYENLDADAAYAALATQAEEVDDAAEVLEDAVLVDVHVVEDVAELYVDDVEVEVDVHAEV